MWPVLAGTEDYAPVMPKQITLPTRAE